MRRGGAGGEDEPRSLPLAAASCPRSGANASLGTARLEVASETFLRINSLAEAGRSGRFSE